MKSSRFQKWLEKLKIWVKLILNWRFLVCFGLGWMITNGWSYILLGVGVFWGIDWMAWLASGYLAIIWFPFSPEKIITVGIAIFLAHRLFPTHTHALIFQIKAVAQKTKKKLVKRFKKNMKNAEMKYRLVIFDLDGTLLDTLEDLYKSVKFALKKSNFPTRSREEVKSFIGNGVPKLIERAVPADCPPEARERVYADFTKHYELHCADHTKPYDGITELLYCLRQEEIQLAVVSNKDDYAVKALCEQYFKGFFDAAVGGKADVRKKPAPDTVYEVLRSLDVEAHEAVYVGDTGVDIETARNAGMPCISVSWGFRSVEHLMENGAEIIVHSTEALLDQLKS